MEPELNYATLLEWCQKELAAAEEMKKACLTDEISWEFEAGKIDVLTSLIIHFDLEGK